MQPWYADSLGINYAGNATVASLTGAKVRARPLAAQTKEMSPSAAIERDLVIVACAISAGIHAALVPDHLNESVGAGIGFLASAVLLTGLVVVLTRRTSGLVAIAAAGAVLAGLLAAYALAATTGFPLLHPEPESIDGLALTTKAIEVVGLLAALRLIGRDRPAPVPRFIHTKGARAQT